ncbi:MAG: Eco57I restriction-modification methylase domain-containing protein [Candidatus Brachytrichaceae bacterium NZ_4S206]|jgi:hypothetical protein
MPDVIGALPKLTPDSLRALFAEALRWDAQRGTQPLDVGAPLSRRLTLHRIAMAGGVRVFAIVLPDLPTLSARRAIFRALRPIAAEHLVIYCAEDAQQALFVWPRLRHAEGGADAYAPAELRVLPYEVGFPARTTLEQLAKLRLPLDRAPTLETVLTHLADAFSVESVTERFFNDYKRVFEQLQNALHAQTQDARWAHDFALQTLNRLVFIYFIQRKRYAEGAYWLGNNPRFVRDFWRAYREQAANDPAANFYADWLRALFFAAFNQRFQAGRSDYRHFPTEIREALAAMPYLNGGLFTENALDTRHTFTIPDAFFEQLFDRFDGDAPGFLERYNFTVSESTPLDVEVAVDPEMIGKVYESLVNLTERGATTEDRRGMAGIFYTPRTEIDLMCRLALVDALAARVAADRALLYDWVFAADPEDKRDADRRVTEADLWRALDDAARRLTICDPACGSGSFLVGMLQVLDDLQARCAEALGREETPYDRRRRIVGEQLYGVDVMDWAVHVAELRLWLQLTVETDLRQPEAQLKPLLPNLSFKIRQGDSLVQEIGGVNLGLHHGRTSLPPALKGRITQLKARKLRFYQGDRALNEPMLRQEETGVFRDILKHRLKALEDELAHKRRALADLPVAQIGLGLADVGDHDAAAEKRAALEATIAALEDERQRVRAALEALGAAGQALPFVWDIAFVEVFADEAGGFDIVIGNPPYVRQEIIAPPNASPDDFGGESSDRWRELKRSYKEKLQAAVAAAFPRFFGYRPGRSGFRRLNAQSDLYVYFYFHGLSLLNPRGCLCFITSNSWLDVAYGADLQEFALRHCPIRLIVENARVRSFSQADVNTVIVLLGAPDERGQAGRDALARFVTFHAPFDQVSAAATFRAVEAATARQATDLWRVFPVPQRDLLAESMAAPADDDAPRRRDAAPRYAGGKWGGKYLRAPDIAFVILEKGRDKLVRLGEVAEVRFGIKTGANEFFYLQPAGVSVAEVAQVPPDAPIAVRNAAGWEGEIEARFLRPVLKSPRECRAPVVRLEDLSNLIFMCHAGASDLKGTRALRYIRWGERQGYPARPSCRSRARWWDVGARDPASLNVNYLVDEVMRFFVQAGGLFVSDNFQECHVSQGRLWQTGVSANSTVFQLFANVAGRANFGGGLMKIQTYEVAGLEIVSPEFLGERDCKRALQQAGSLALDGEDRRRLDDLVFDALGLTQGEREAVYEAAQRLVAARLARARSAQEG